MKKYANKMLMIVGALGLLYGVLAGISDNDLAGAVAVCAAAAAIAFATLALSAD
jgi:hypothetical protein